jgi:hypothetical protein
VAGIANSVIAYEHADIRNLILAQDINGLIADSGPAGNSVAHNGIHVGYMWCQTCTNELAGGVNPAAVQIDLMDIENGTGHGINDPSNLLTGRVNYLVMQASGAVTPTNPATNGAANLCLNNIVYPGVSTGPCALAPIGIPIQLTSLVDNFPSQEGGGSTLLNTGSNTTNTATATAVTWARSPGFNGTVATYNGTTSTATATSNNTYDGTTAFSVCAWINPPTLPTVDATIVGDVGGSAPFPGWRMDLFGNVSNKGAIQVWMINTVSTNYIYVGTPFSVVVPNAANLACFTYDGSKTATGVHINVNGANQTLTITSNTLTGSILSSLPVTIGSNAGTAQFFPGAIGRVRIFSRVLSAAEMQALYTTGPSAF